MTSQPETPCSPFPTHRGRNKEHTPFPVPEPFPRNTEQTLFPVPHPLCQERGTHENRSTPHGGEASLLRRLSGIRLVGFSCGESGCAHVVLTDSENRENMRIVSRPSDRESDVLEVIT